MQAFPRPTFGKQETRFNNYGGTLGGPIRQNKMFLFGNYEQYNYASALPAYFSLPTALEQTGNFSDLGQLVSGVCQPSQNLRSVHGNHRRSQRPSSREISSLTAASTRLPESYEKLFYPMPNNSTVPITLVPMPIISSTRFQ